MVSSGVHNAGQADTLISGNHLGLGGRLCSDVSPIYTYLQSAAGTVISKNWVHDTKAQWNLLGIRGDDKTRNLTIEHNVVWSCGTVGIVAKGEGNVVRHNTCLNNSRVNMTSRPFPRDIEMASTHDLQDPSLSVQGAGDLCANNVMEHFLTGDMITGSMPAGTLLSNYQSPNARQELRCPPTTSVARVSGQATECVRGSVLDFRPRPGSVLIGAAAANGGLGGLGPDIGTRDPWSLLVAVP